jgi:hypothetical protein
METTGPRPARPSDPKTWTTFAVLAIPPVIFLLVTVGFAFYFGSRGAEPQQIAARTQEAASWILLGVQVLLLVLVAVLSGSKDGIGWSLPSGRRLGVETAIGLAWGAALGVAYVFALAPALTWVQGAMGDYVPAGSVMPTVGRSLWPFLIADVVLAPFVEESIYRGWATSRLLVRFGTIPTAVIVCSSFGLLHWVGGLWYMLLTGFVAGGLFIALRLARQNMAVAFGAHLGVNVVEYLFVWLAG